MSSTQLSLDDFSLPKQQTQYDLAMALSIKAQQQHSSYYSHSGLDAYMTGSHPSRHIHHPSSSASAYPYMPEQPTQFSAQYFDGNVPLYEVQPGPHSFTQMQQRPPSPPLSYASTGWHAADGYTNFHPDPAAMNAALFQNVHPMFVAGSSAQPNQTPRALHPAQQSATQPSWSLSGSLDPVTGVFQRTPEHPRMRTAQACEKCRIRKAKCSGDHPSCQRCTARGLQCEYAPERKMRGPNKTKRKSISVHDRQGASPSGRRMSLASSSSSSDEVGSGLEFVDIPLAVAATAAIPVSPHDPTPSPLSAHMSPPDSFHRDVPGPLDFSINHAHVLAMPPMSHDDAAQQQRARLPSIELGDAAIYPQAFHQFVGSDPTFVSDIMQDDSSTQGSRRSSLPAYLLESYSRIALAAHPMDHGALVDPSTFAAHSIADAMDTIRSTSQESSHEMSPRDALSSYSHPRSSSSASATSPITPISLPEVGYENPGELAYPLQYPDEFGDELGVEAPQHSESPPVELQIPEPYRPKSPFAWVHTDVDTEAPTAADNEKSMEELESMSSQP